MRLKSRDFTRQLAGRLLLAALSTALVAAGCSNTSVRPEQVEEDVYPARSCPDSVLAKLNRAYVGMDADAYLDCLADSFSFWLLGQDWSNPDDDLPKFWGKPVEEQIHHRMFGDTTVVDAVHLDMYTETSEFVAGPDTSDPYDDRWVYEQDVELRIFVGEWTFLATADQLFTFAREPGRADTLWWITEWHEVEPWVVSVGGGVHTAQDGAAPGDVPFPRGDRVEDSSWGSIKALWM